jgi:predicted dehydrogenase
VLKVAIAGCGKIADEHARQIRHSSYGQLIACCDAEPLMARQLRDRFGAVDYAGLDQLLSESRPDVVHITTPPHSHFSLAMKCLDAGCHIFVEKPFTMDAHEARIILETATARCLKVTVGHNLQFGEPAIRLRSLVAEGFLGGSPTHLESYYSYDLGDPGYALAFLSDSGHWLRTLPGGLLQNIISHGIARIAEYLESESPAVVAHAFTSPFLRSLGEHRLRDELRVVILDGPRTAYFTFSSQMRPTVSELRVFGPRRGLLLDDNHHLVVKLNGAKYKSYLDTFIPPLTMSSQYLKAALRNVRGFLGGTFDMNEGMRALIRLFYRSIAEDQPVPIPYREILVTARVMDAIFAQLAGEPRDPVEITEAQLSS